MRIEGGSVRDVRRRVGKGRVGGRSGDLRRFEMLVVVIWRSRRSRTMGIVRIVVERVHNLRYIHDKDNEGNKREEVGKKEIAEKKKRSKRFFYSDERKGRSPISDGQDPARQTILRSRQRKNCSIQVLNDNGTCRIAILGRTGSIRRS